MLIKRSLECQSFLLLISVSLILVSLRKWRRRSGIQEGGHQRHDTTVAEEHEHHEDEERIHPRKLHKDSASVFKLYGEEDKEPAEPPIPLCESVQATLASYNVDPVRGFLPSTEPLQRLPQQEYQAWETLVDAIPALLAAGQARKPVEELPVIPVDKLTCHRERMRAMLVLSVLAHASVWGDRDRPNDTIPRGVAVPLHKLAEEEGMPPIMTHMSLVLNNWRRLDPAGPIVARNLACCCRFLGGQDETWFYTATVEIEAKGGSIFGALLQAQHAIAEAEASPSPRVMEASAKVVLRALEITRQGIQGMRKSLLAMSVGCHPLIFYERVRPFLAGWKANPTLPEGVLYEGVDSRRRQYYGGSAAQSSIFPALDAALNVSHERHSSNKFLLQMRDYMPPGHRRLVEHFADPACPSIRNFVDSFPRYSPRNGRSDQEGLVGSGRGGCRDDVKISRVYGGKRSSSVHGDNGSDVCDRDGAAASVALREAYNDCLQDLEHFRAAHLGIVTSYILQQQKRESKATNGNSRGNFAGGKGTGGTALHAFLRPLKDDTRGSILG